MVLLADPSFRSQRGKTFGGTECAPKEISWRKDEPISTQTECTTSIPRPPRSSGLAPDRTGEPGRSQLEIPPTVYRRSREAGSSRFVEGQHGGRSVKQIEKML